MLRQQFLQAFQNCMLGYKGLCTLGPSPGVPYYDSRRCWSYMRFLPALALRQPQVYTGQAMRLGDIHKRRSKRAIPGVLGTVYGRRKPVAFALPGIAASQSCRKATRITQRDHRLGQQVRAHSPSAARPHVVQLENSIVSYSQNNPTNAARRRSGSYATAHGAHRGLNLLFPGRVGLKNVLDERLTDRQQLRELALDLHPATKKARIADSHNAEASWGASLRPSIADKLSKSRVCPALEQQACSVG